jgi:phosphatidate cytidylyltransferase
MTVELPDRLFNWRHAFDHPVTLWITTAIGAALAIAPISIAGLSAAGLIKKDLRSELWKRTISWMVMAPMIVVPILAGAFWTIGAIAALSMLCFREYSRATGIFREQVLCLIVIAGIALLNLAALDHWYGLFQALAPLVIILIAAVAILPDRPKGYLQRTGLSIFGFAFFGVCLAHLSYTANDRDYRPILLLILVSVQLNDILAFCCGKTFGRRKLAPSTSPGKTIGGSLGSLVLTTPLVAFLGHHVFRGTPLDSAVPLIALGLIISVGGQLGDLMISSIKRDVGVKDMGGLIPGHGGVLDRCNSLLLVAPAVFHYVGYLRPGLGLEGPTRIFTGQ